MPIKPSDNPKPWKKGQSGNPKGRPRKWVSYLKNRGYKLVEINDAIQNLLEMTQEELKTVEENKKATALEVSVSRALLRSISEESLSSIETLLTRAFGKPKETIDAKINAVKVIFE